MTILALADDATGALETGARFSQAGLTAEVRFEPALGSARPALVLDTETRHLSPQDAEQITYRIAARAREARVSFLYKKTDSTLRGNIPAEFQGLLSAFPDLPLLYAPAYPALGRTVRNGELFLDGRRLHETAFARDPLNPSAESSLSAVLASLPRTFIQDPGELQEGVLPGRVYICDGTTDRDLSAVAAFVRTRPCLAAGTAAFASALAAQIQGQPAPPWSNQSPVNTCLVVNGSLHPVSRAQVEACALPSANLSHSPAHIARLLQTHRWASLAAPATRSDAPSEVAGQLARLTAETLRIFRPDCLLVCGGDTTLAILRELGISSVEPEGEALPGAAVSSTAAGFRLLTKAGGFGGPDYLQRLRHLLAPRRELL